MLPARFHRLRTALIRRQPDLTVLLENVHKSHNFAAVLRTCDAAGVFEAHGVYPPGEDPTRNMAAAGIRRWVRVRRHPDLAAAIRHLVDGGFTLVAAHPTEEATDYRKIDYTRPTALVLGQEKDGLSPAAIEAAGELVSIPMGGLGTSLNVSVAAALILFEARRQREEAGFFATPRLESALFDRTLFEWAYPRLAEHCRRKGAAYPRLGPDGELLDEPPR